jgi:molecular chaperone GrpE
MEELNTDVTNNKNMIQEEKEIIDYKQKYEELENSFLEQKNKYLYLAAEYDNYKKRVKKEKEEIIFNTKISMLDSILEIDNDLNIAIKNIKDKSAKNGVKLIISKLEKFLNTQGIESIQTDTYDANIHEVISILKDDSNKIVDVVNKGYTLNGITFKHPKVILG